MCRTEALSRIGAGVNVVVTLMGAVFRDRSRFGISQLSTQVEDIRRNVEAAERRNDDLDVWMLVRMILRRLPVVVVTAGAIIAITLVIVLGIEPRYVSEAQILIDNAESTFTKSERENSQIDAGVDQAAVQSEVQVLLSRDLAATVSEKTELAEYDEFSGLGRKLSLPFRILAMVGIGTREVLPTDERVIDTYYARLSVSQIDESRVIAVRFSAEDAPLAAEVANALADAYIESSRENRFATDRDAASWLEGEISDLREKVAEAEEQVERFRGRYGLLQAGRDSTLYQQQLSELNTRLVAARGRESEARARAELVRRLIGEPGGIDAAAEVLNSRLIQRLRELQAAQSRDIAERSATLLPGHPRMRQLRAEKADLDRRIRDEIGKIAQGLENEANIADAQVAELSARLEDFKREAAEAREAEVKLRALERESTSQRDLLESFLRRFREASARVDLPTQPANARIISRATVSGTPSWPKVMPVMALTSVAAILLGLVAAFIVEQLAAPRLAGARLPGPRARAHPALRAGLLDRESRASTDAPVRHSAETEPEASRDDPAAPPAPAAPPPLLTNPPEPLGTALQTDQQGDAAAIRDSQPAPATTAERQVQSIWQVSRRIARVCRSRGHRRILVVDHDGSAGSDVAMFDIACAFGEAGHRTVLVELTGNGRVAALAGLPPRAGAAEVLNGAAGLSDVVVATGNENLSVIMDGIEGLPPIIPADRFRRVAEALESRFDIVIVIAGALSDETLALITATDFILVAVAPEMITGDGLGSVVEQLRDAGVGDAAVLTTGPAGVNLYEASGAQRDVPHVA